MTPGDYVRQLNSHVVLRHHSYAQIILRKAFTVYTRAYVYSVIQQYHSLLYILQNYTICVFNKQTYVRIFIPTLFMSRKLKTMEMSINSRI